MKQFGILHLTWKNFRQRPYRNSILILCVASVVCLMVASEVMDRASQRGVKLGMARLGSDLIAVPRGLTGQVLRSFAAGDAEMFYMKSDIQEEFMKHDFVELISPQLYIKSSNGSKCCSLWNTHIIGFDPKTDFTIKPWLINNNLKIGPHDAISGLALEKEKGDIIKFFGQTFTVTGILDKTKSSLDSSVFVPLSTVYEMAKTKKRISIAQGNVSAILIKLKPEQEGGLPAWKAAYKLERAIRDITIIRPKEIVKKSRGNLEDALITLQTASYATWPVTVLLIGLVFTMAANERRREIGLLRAMGARRAFIFKAILLEALIISGLGGVIGSLISVGLISGFSQKISMAFKASIRLPGFSEISLLFITVMGIALLTGMIAAAIPALRASKMEPYEAIRKVV